ncbi:hypothetical protein V5T82_07940 [Magnetovibrio sp. PR-2]|uniref:hypothetical protein n=1 Tax=Magnetovibrio sp. PR-2 TaxID=3120356 RepID=UPI002FCDFC9F
MSEAAEELIREELEKAASLITGARQLMAEGRHVELSAMEERIRAVTEAITTAPEAIASNYKDHLVALSAALDALETDLETHQKAREDGLNAIRHREAKDAYGPPKK